MYLILYSYLPTSFINSTDSYQGIVATLTVGESMRVSVGDFILEIWQSVGSAHLGTYHSCF
jgi:hypothetical protein